MAAASGVGLPVQDPLATAHDMAVGTKEVARMSLPDCIRPSTLNRRRVAGDERR